MSKIVFTNGIILNGHKDMVPTTGLNIFVNEEKIEKISDDHNFGGYQVVDLAGKYIMPGLINLHVHLPGSGKPKSSSSGDIKKTIDKVMSLPPVIRNAIGSMLTKGSSKTELFSGVTTVRCVGGVADFDSQARDRINAGKMIGPRLLVANQAIAPLHGHMAGSVSIECVTIEDALQALDHISKTKPDLIKLMITGGVLDAEKKGEPGVLKMSAEMVKACCDKAHSLGYQVAAHVESAQGVRVGLENGVDTIEHGAAVDEEILKLYKDNDASFVATISPALPFALFDREVSGASEMAQYNGNIVFEGTIQSAITCVENGVRVGLGTDTGCPYITHYDMWREVYYFHKYCNMSNNFALHTATLVNAQVAKVDNVTGSIDVGKDADMIVTKGNPLEDLTVLRNIDMVMGRGKLYTNPKVKKYADCEEQLDKFL